MYLLPFGPRDCRSTLRPHAMCPTSTWFYFFYIFIILTYIYMFILSVLVLTVLNLPNGIVQLAPVANAA